MFILIIPRIINCINSLVIICIALLMSSDILSTVPLQLLIDYLYGQDHNYIILTTLITLTLFPLITLTLFPLITLILFHNDIESMLSRHRFHFTLSTTRALTPTHHRKHILAYTYTSTCVHTNTHTHSHSRKQSCTHTQTHKHIHVHIDINTLHLYTNANTEQRSRSHYPSQWRSNRPTQERTRSTWLPQECLKPL